MTEQAWTIRTLLRWMWDDFKARGLEAPRVDAEVLIAHVLGVKRVELYMDMERPLAEAELAQIRALVVRRRNREPVAYLLGEREFYGRPFKVDKRVLVPRPDTETVVEQALACLPAGDGAGLEALDLCTGTGCIGLTLAAERSALQVDLVDLSPDALAVAQENAEALGLTERVRCYQGDLWAALPEARQYTLITSNPPYVSEADWASLAPDVRDHEPRLALWADRNGYACYEALVVRALQHLRPGGHMILEVGIGQAEQVERLCRSAGFSETASYPDLGGIMRAVVASAAP